MNRSYVITKTLTPTQHPIVSLLYDLQYTAVAHSEYLGYTKEFLYQNHSGWAVLHWHVVIHAMPNTNELLQIETWCHKCKRLQAERSHHIQTIDGTCLVDAMSRWVFLDLETRRPQNIPTDMVQAYLINQPAALPNETFRTEKINDTTPISCHTYTVTEQDIDGNQHVNNVTYLIWAISDIPKQLLDTCHIKELHMVYRKECYVGDVIFTKTTQQIQNSTVQTHTQIVDQNDVVLAEAILYFQK